MLQVCFIHDFMAVFWHAYDGCPMDHQKALNQLKMSSVDLCLALLLTTYFLCYLYTPYLLQCHLNWMKIWFVSCKLKRKWSWLFQGIVLGTDKNRESSQFWIFSPSFEILTIYIQRCSLYGSPHATSNSRHLVTRPMKIFKLLLVTTNCDIFFTPKDLKIVIL